MLVSVGRAPLVEGIGLEAAGVAFDRRKGIGADDAPPHARAAHLRGRRLRRLLAARPHRLPRGRGRRRERLRPRRRSSTTAPCRARSTPIPEIAGVGLTEAEAREQYGDDVAVGRFPWVANARAVMQNETTGWVKSIHETRYGELLGLVMVGPHVTDLIEAGVVAIDAESTVETVADGMAPHPTLSEAIKEAGPRRARPRDPPAEPQENTTATGLKPRISQVFRCSRRLTLVGRALVLPGIRARPPVPGALPEPAPSPQSGRALPFRTDWRQGRGRPQHAAMPSPAGRSGSSSSRAANEVTGGSRLRRLLRRKKKRLQPEGARRARLPPAQDSRHSCACARAATRERAIEHGPPREEFSEVFRYYTLAKRAEWQVRDLPWNDAAADPGVEGLGGEAGAAPRHLALGDHAAAAGRRARGRDGGAALRARAPPRGEALLHDDGAGRGAPHRGVAEADRDGRRHRRARPVPRPARAR